jgi:hypothetical protein
MGSLGPGPANVTMNNNSSSSPATLNTNGIPMSSGGGLTVVNKPVGLIPGTQQSHLQMQGVIGTQVSGVGAVVTTSMGSSGPFTTSGQLPQQTFINTSGGGIQILNMNPVRASGGGGAGTMTSGGPTSKSVTPRMVLGPQVIGATRAGQPGVSQFTTLHLTPISPILLS